MRIFWEDINWVWSIFNNMIRKKTFGDIGYFTGSTLPMKFMRTGGNCQLNAGIHKMRILMGKAGFTVNWVKFELE